MSAYRVIVTAKIISRPSAGEEVVEITVSGFPSRDEALWFKDWLKHVITESAGPQAIGEWQPLQ